MFDFNVALLHPVGRSINPVWFVKFYNGSLKIFLVQSEFCVQRTTKKIFSQTTITNLFTNKLQLIDLPTYRRYKKGLKSQEIVILQCYSLFSLN